MFGDIDDKGLHTSTPSEEIFNNYMWLKDTYKDTKKVFLGTKQNIGDYVENMISSAKSFGIEINENNYKVILVDSDDELLSKLNEISNTIPKFDYIIQNPPYKKTLHIDFFKKGISMLNETGKMTIIEPATWLIDLKDSNPRSISNKIYLPFKKELEGHIISAEIENRNNEFKTEMYVPFSNIFYSRCGTKTSKIEFKLCGTKTYVDSLFDANAIGKKSVINSILSKISTSDVVHNHIIKRDKVSNVHQYYLQYRDIITKMAIF